LLGEAIGNARSHGVIFVAAAGNDGSNDDSTPVYPAGFAQNNVVSVAAVDRNGNLTSFSNYGVRSVDLAAPGVDVLSTVPGGYGYNSGTSMATPMVSGVMALVWSQHPDWSYSQVINQVLGTVTRLPGLQGKVASGGMVNAAAALGVVASSSTSARVIGSSASGPSANTLSTIRVTFDRGINASTLNFNDVSLVGPAGRIHLSTISVVGGSGNRSFDIRFATQRAPGTYTLDIGAGAKDLAGKHIVPYQRAFTINRTPSKPAPGGGQPPSKPAPGGGARVVSSTASGPNASTLTTIRVTFDRVINPATFTRDDVGLLGPGHRVAITAITVVGGSGNRSFDIHFATQRAAGTYTLYIGAEAKDSSGHRITPYQAQFKLTSARPTPTPKPTPKPTVTSLTSSTRATILPGGRGVSLLTVGQDMVIASVTVKVNVTAPHVGDLTIHVEAPDGTDIVLMQRMGGASANLQNVTFDDRANTSIAFARAPLMGSYRPLTALSHLAGRTTRGTWKLWVENSGHDRDTLTSWTLTVTPRR
jgi:subtilisin-like proprotein convertase family protein